jgi:hypothetical protein
MPAETMEENRWKSLKELFKKTHEVFQANIKNEAAGKPNQRGKSKMALRCSWLRSAVQIYR